MRVRVARLRFGPSRCGVPLVPPALEEIGQRDLEALHTVARRLAEGDAAGVLLVNGRARDFTGGEAGAQRANEHLVVEDEVVAESVEGNRLEELSRVGTIAGVEFAVADAEAHAHRAGDDAIGKVA